MGALAPKRGEPTRQRGLGLVALSLSWLVSLFLAFSPIGQGCGHTEAGAVVSGFRIIPGLGLWSLGGSHGSRSWDAGDCEIESWC